MDIFIKEFLNLHKNGLKKSQDIYAASLFYIIGFILLAIITTTSTTITFATVGMADQSKYEAIITLAFINYIPFCLFLFFILFDINTMSQDIKDHLDQLKLAILEHQLMNGSNEKLEQVWAIIDNYSGFSCYGYATLGRPLLTSITETFVTYIIILFQFKQSEL